MVAAPSPRSRREEAAGGAQRPARGGNPEGAPRNTSLIAMDSAITLWQFLLQLLQEPHNKHMICWTSNNGEFKLLQAEEVARLQRF